MRASKFTDSLAKLYEEISTVVNEFHLLRPQAGKGLLNVSNHPSEKWLPEQQDLARKNYGTVEDLAFPNIPPELTGEKLAELVDDFYYRIRKKNPAAVHLMGEMTFTHALVKRLQAAGITCVASTTHRIVEERDGKKVVQFKFVQFREYP